jgi:hypothetical protein
LLRVVRIFPLPRSLRILPQIHEALADEGYDPRVLRARETTLRMYGRKVLVPSADKGAALE